MFAISLYFGYWGKFTCSKVVFSILAQSLPDGSVLLAVITAAERTEQRKVIRETWCGRCNSLSNCYCIFVLGMPESFQENQDLVKEAEKERDILQFDMLDSYNNLTLKTMHSIRYVPFFAEDLSTKHIILPSQVLVSFKCPLEDLSSPDPRSGWGRQRAAPCLTPSLRCQCPLAGILPICNPVFNT